MADVIVEGKRMSEEEFKQLKETLETDKSKKLTEVSPNNFKILKKIKG